MFCSALGTHFTLPLTCTLWLYNGIHGVAKESLTSLSEDLVKFVQR